MIERHRRGTPASIVPERPQRERDRPQARPARFERREKVADPNSPFAKLAALKAQLEADAKERRAECRRTGSTASASTGGFGMPGVVRTREAAAALPDAGYVRVNGTRIDARAAWCGPAT